MIQLLLSKSRYSWRLSSAAFSHDRPKRGAKLLPARACLLAHLWCAKVFYLPGLQRRNNLLGHQSASAPMPDIQAYVLQFFILRGLPLSGCFHCINRKVSGPALGQTTSRLACDRHLAQTTFVHWMIRHRRYDKKKGCHKDTPRFAWPSSLVHRSFCFMPAAWPASGASAPAPCRPALDGPSGRRSVPRHPNSATAGGAAAGVALHAGAVAHQRVVAAFAAGLALVSLHLRLGPRIQ